MMFMRWCSDVRRPGYRRFEPAVGRRYTFRLITGRRTSRIQTISESNRAALR